MAIFALLVFVAILGTMGFVMYRVLKKTDPKRLDTSTIENITTAQEFIPFENIKDGMIILGGHKYRAIIDCSSSNYNLKTDKEKEIIEISFQRFVNSLTFPIVFYIQTKVMDMSNMLTSLKEELISTIEKYPQLEAHAEDFFKKMSNLNAHIGNNVQKKKYIIVSYEDANSLQNLSDEEKYDYSSKELYNRASILAENLSSVGVKSKILNTTELYELVYSTYHKNDYSQVNNITNNDYLSMITEDNQAKIHNITDDAKIDWILYEAQTRLNNELLNLEIPDFIRKNAEDCVLEIEKIREKISGYYKSETEEIKDMNEESFDKIFNQAEDDKSVGGNL